MKVFIQTQLFSALRPDIRKNACGLWIRNGRHIDIFSKDEALGKLVWIDRHTINPLTREFFDRLIPDKELIVIIEDKFLVGSRFQ